MPKARERGECISFFSITNRLDVVKGGDDGFARNSPIISFFYKKVLTLNKTMIYQNQWAMTVEMTGD
ncbi:MULTISPECIES: hypothetical protein [Pseudomonas]|uniref:hypothetical protein n=1 Tax=Pseudomonas sp. BF-R-19 TaxID=2832397 RepID=UPI001CC03C9B|nr:hypothetical protein [Pseudomonas sp. BF-R-19]